METKTKVYIAAGVLIIAGIAFYVFGGNRSGTNSGFDGVKNALNNTADEQRDVSNKLGSINSGVDGSISSVGQLQSANSGLENQVSNLETQVSNSKSITLNLQNQLVTVKQQMQEALQLSLKTESSLQDANKLLVTYNKEEQQKIAQANKEKKEWQIITIAIAIAYAVK